MKLKIYIMHSEKIDYKNEIYEPLSSLNSAYDLIFPLSEKYQSTYIKELFQTSDIIICDLTKNNLLEKIEMKMAEKSNKPIFYLINENDKKISKYKNIDIKKYKNKEEFIIIVKNILDSLNYEELFLKRDNIVSLGKIVKNKYN